LSNNLLNDENNVTSFSPEAITATLINPQSSFCGDLVNILQIYGTEKVECLVRLPDGTRTRVPIEWTDYSVEPDVKSVTSNKNLKRFVKMNRK
jgi:hypothetical protein